jgi:hypothetical protein
MALFVVEPIVRRVTTESSAIPEIVRVILSGIQRTAKALLEDLVAEFFRGRNINS